MTLTTSFDLEQRFWSVNRDHFICVGPAEEPEQRIVYLTGGITIIVSKKEAVDFIQAS